jgi:hypothetical protein
MKLSSESKDFQLYSYLLYIYKYALINIKVMCC